MALANGTPKQKAVPRQADPTMSSPASKKAKKTFVGEKVSVESEYEKRLHAVKHAHHHITSTELSVL